MSTLSNRLEERRKRSTQEAKALIELERTTRGAKTERLRALRLAREEKEQPTEVGTS
jgi:hypothetical protein